MDRDAIDNQVRTHYEDVWRKGDAWNLEASPFEQARYDYLLKKISDRRYPRVLEIGCGSGGLTRRLASVGDYVLAMDIASAAIERARIQIGDVDPKHVELRVQNAMQYEPATDGPWDLIVLAETIYSLGWLYPFFDLGYFLTTLRDATRSGGRFLLANTYGGDNNWLLMPSLIDTYRDLVRNVGFTIEWEEIFTGIKDGVEMRILVTMFSKSA